MQLAESRYSLYAVLVHSGWSTHSGHYYCFVRTTADTWHVLDDSRVFTCFELMFYIVRCVLCCIVISYT